MKFDEKLFRNPTAKYRGAPFWAWNCALTPELLKSQIETFKKMGFGGFYMHSRTGLASEFMGDEYLKAVEFCVKTAKEESMLAYLYDEDRWPSGFGGGFVTENPEFRSRYLCFTPFAYGEGKSFDVEFTAQATAGRNEKGRLLSCYDVVLDDCGFISHYERIPETKAPRGTKWYAYLETEQPSDWYNGNTYVDTLNKKAIEQFLAVVHEKYKALLGDEFGKTIPNIFTDEPQFSHKTILSNPFSKEDVILPWTDDFADTYKRAYGDDILDFLPEIFWEKQDGISAARYRFHDHSTERFVSAFIDTVGEWCRESGIKLVGHMMEEPTLQSQTSALGEAMRTYRSFGVVGIDMLCNSYEYNTVKQAQSVAHQRGLSGIMCEMYGVTGWDFDFRGHKSQGDWQAALGVTHRVPHLAWMSMSGEAKRDYPASIGYQSPWYEKYNVIEDYFARLGTVLDSGNPVVRIAVIHPIESYWLMWGPDSQTSPQREEMEERFGELTKWLLFSGMDFDFICESILPELCTDIGNPLKVGVMSYDAIIVPPLKNIRKTTADILKTFASKGGKLIFLEKEPGYINLEARTLEFTDGTLIPFSKTRLLNELSAFREVEFRLKSGCLCDDIIYQLRENGDERWLFLCHGKPPKVKHRSIKEDFTVTVNGECKAYLYDAFSGNSYSANYTHSGGKTSVDISLYNLDSALIRLTNKDVDTCRVITADYSNQIFIPSVVPVRLCEDNVLLLDYAEYALDNGDYNPPEEILRADNRLRAMAGLEPRKWCGQQPWAEKQVAKNHKARLRFRITCQAQINDVKLGFEYTEGAQIILNGREIAPIVCGFFTDHAIKTIEIGTLIKGENILELSIPFGNNANIEWCYLLGNFSVNLNGCEKTLTCSQEKIGFGDITSQGMPFYGGSIIYDLPVEFSKDTPVKLHIPHYEGALISVLINDCECGDIIFQPYNLEFVAPKDARLSLKLWGNRANCFGPVHWRREGENLWMGPREWRREGDGWCDTYQLSPFGILSTPLILSIQKEMVRND